MNDPYQHWPAAHGDQVMGFASDHCPHGELDAVCRACCDPLTVDDWDQEWHREQRRRSGLLAAGLLLVAALVVGIAWWLR